MDIGPGIASGLIVEQSELDRRTVRQHEYVSCNQAFIDCRTPGSELKENYSIVGPGVTQSAEQVVNLQERHGFNIGAAAMPPGVVNNLHLHFTAEVFLNWQGSWTMTWGAHGDEVRCDEGDVVSMPTWIFRGFTSIGEKRGWLFTVLGFDNTGGIIWGPSVLRTAQGHGLYLTVDNELIDTVAGDAVPDAAELVPPMQQSEIHALRTWTLEQMQERIVRQRDLSWSKRPFLCSDLPGGAAELATVIGYGMTEDRDQVPPIHYPHNFNVAWLRARSAEGVLQHRHLESQVLIGYRGRWQIILNDDQHQVSTELSPSDTISVPAGAWRQFVALDDEAQMLVVNSGDGRVRLEWPPESVRHAVDKGFATDAAGYVAPWNVVRYSTVDG